MGLANVWTRIAGGGYPGDDDAPISPPDFPMSLVETPASLKTADSGNAQRFPFAAIRDFIARNLT